MRRDDAINRLQNNRDQLTMLGAGRLFIYGSVARDEATLASDVDLLVDPLDPDFSIFRLAHLQDACTDILGVPAEVHDYDGYLRLPTFQRRVGHDLIRVF